jgi:hypothetical protein
MFDKYFRQFESNDGRRNRYQIILFSGKVFSGVPVAAADATNSGTFSVTLDDGRVIDVDWGRLLAATQITQLSPV